jgi:predicted NUDIX family NTP pyrophosphohydrolase
MKTSAGILLYRIRSGALEVLLVHPGGPFWARKDEGAWSIPKGEFIAPEDPEVAARREFLEETGMSLTGEPIALTPLKQPSGKLVYAFAAEGDFDPAQLRSNTFILNGKEYPEVDKAAWYSCDEAARKILKGQRGFIEELKSIARPKGSVKARL